MKSAEYICSWQETDWRHSLRFGHFHDAAECCDAALTSGFDAHVAVLEDGRLKRIYPSHSDIIDV